MTVANASYKFLYVDVGTEGGTWSNDDLEENRAGVNQSLLMTNTFRMGWRICSLNLADETILPSVAASTITHVPLQVVSCLTCRGECLLNFESNVLLLLDDDASASRHIQPDHHACLCTVQTHQHQIPTRNFRSELRRSGHTWSDPWWMEDWPTPAEAAVSNRPSYSEWLPVTIVHVLVLSRGKKK